MNMELHLGFFFSLILCALLIQESAGLGFQSWLVSSLPFRGKGAASYGTIHGGGSHRLSLLQNENWVRDSTPSQLLSPHKHNHFNRKVHHIAPEPYHKLPRAPYSRKGRFPKAPAMAHSPASLPSSRGWISAGPLPLSSIPFSHVYVPSTSPIVSPRSNPMNERRNAHPPLLSMTLPSPPPNHECATLTCTEPLTYTPPGTPCACVWPIEVRLRFSIPLYTFFPSVAELAEEIAASIQLNRSQVRIMGADAADQQLEKTTVLINLVPLEESFEAATAFSIYTKFWKRELAVKTSVFGVYDVVYVRYPGLPPSPPSQTAGSATIDVQPYPANTNDKGPMKPLGVDIPKRRKNNPGKNMVIIVVLSSVTAFVVFFGLLLLILSKCGCLTCLPRRRNHSALISSDRKPPSGGERLLTLRSRPSSGSMSFSSSLRACTGTARVFNIEDIERATDNFDASRIVGEGGFGLVYGGILDNGREVAVKVLKRADQQGSREFLAEVEMLGRLHHRNLVKLIGICAEDHCRCLVYGLVPNGSVESHLHGADKIVGPLDWHARMKIALGSARGLAYLHEDSSPRVIHRDFKSSNILLEHDYTPKVSDFGLARAAMEEGSKHISTHVMGTFGYLAPEYAMTGHLLVKSDVYSYGVVLLELLTGRKPVDLSQPPGQENLVSWARPLLATNDGLKTMIDPALNMSVPLDSIAKVAAIASMCVQPEVSHRPFMGEVVQALKLVCNEFEETREFISRSCSQEEFFVDTEAKYSRILTEFVEDSERRDSSYDAKIALSAVDLKSASAAIQGMESESFRRQFNSAPLKAQTRRTFWQRLRLSRGSMSEHEFSSKH